MLKKYRFFWLVVLAYGASLALVAMRTPPSGTGKAFPWRPAEVSFLFDEPGGQGKKGIIEAQLQMIAVAEKYIIADYFLFNRHRSADKTPYPSVCQMMTAALIQQKNDNPALPVLFITDPINNFYGSYQTTEIARLQEASIHVVETDLTKLRDPNPLWAAVWRPLMAPWGSGSGSLGNPIATDAPKVSLRSYLALFNFKANHRKTLATDKGCIISTANPHDASYPNSNCALLIRGETARDVALSELDVADFSGGLDGAKGNEYLSLLEHPTISSPVRSRLLTEEAIGTAARAMIDGCQPGDRIDLAIFYLADEKILGALRDAAKRGVSLRIILDRNIAAFGRKKGTTPNSVSAARLMQSNLDNIEIHWAKDDAGEQFHHKTMCVWQEETATILLGSANFTRRNLANFNLEASVQISGAVDEPCMQDAARWFEGQWQDNSEPWSPQDAPKYWLVALTRLQEFTGLSSF